MKWEGEEQSRNVEDRRGAGGLGGGGRRIGGRGVGIGTIVVAVSGRRAGVDAAAAQVAPAAVLAR